MTATIIDGRVISKEIRDELRGRVEALKAKGVTPGLAFVLVGENPASMSYVASKNQGAAEVGINSHTFQIPADTPQDEVVAVVESLNCDPAWTGILVQLPLPQRHQRGRGYQRHRPGEGRRRHPSGEHRAAAARRADVQARDSGGRPAASPALRQRPGGQARRHLRAVEHRRQAAGGDTDAEGAGRERDGDRLPHADARPAVVHAARRTSSSPRWGPRGRLRAIWCARGRW